MATHIIYKDMICRPGRAVKGEWSTSKLLKDDTVKRLLKKEKISSPTKEQIFHLLERWVTKDQLIINRTDTKVLDKQIALFGERKQVKSIAKKYNIKYKKLTTNQIRDTIVNYLEDKYANIPIIEGLDDWDMVPDEYRFISSDYCFDIRHLCHCIAQGLNHSEYGGPRPKWPSNPYTRQLFTREELFLIRDLLAHHKIGIHVALRNFFDMIDYLEHEKAASNHMYISSALSTKLRFKIINHLDSQSNYTGHWVDKNVRISRFETMRRTWIELGQNLTYSGQRQRQRMDNMPAESYNICKDDIVYLESKSEN